MPPGSHATCSWERPTVTVLASSSHPECCPLAACLQGPRYGVVSMCVGSGMGAAAVFETNGAVPAKE